MGQDDAKCSLRASILRLNAYCGLKAKTAWCCELSHFLRALNAVVRDREAI